jgi:dynein heavy chain 1, cytosolic
MSITQWIPNLASRVTQLDRIAKLDSLRNVEVWLGGLFFPEAYVTATRQSTAHRNKWSLELLHLQLDIEQIHDPNGFIVAGMWSTR